MLAARPTPAGLHCVQCQSQLISLHDFALWRAPRQQINSRHNLRVNATQAQQQSLSGKYQDDIFEQLVERVLMASPSSSKYIVGIAGAPGSGKSTLALSVSRRLNKGAAHKDCAVVVPMDGFHYYRRELDAMADPEAAHARRGAHWTFNAAAFVAAIARIRTEGYATVPSFDHGVGDPVEDDIQVQAHHKYVLVEGNYLLLDLEPWDQLQALFDDTWFIDCPTDVAMRRVLRRQTSIGTPHAIAAARVAGNDRPNAELVAECRSRAQLLVPSRPLRNGQVAAAL